ncbi:MAG: beta-ketoacyl synthase N-terminal-like domain-containing protein, partial [Myxococcaceae bacterium]
LGAVKANVGHLRAAAGAAGLLKAVLALSHRVIPPHPTFERASPRLELERTPFHVPVQPQPFATGSRALAAVSAFSFGGNNYHAVLEAFEAKGANRPTKKISRTPEPLAMIGYGGAFPGANNIPELWQRLLQGMDRTQSVPRERYDIARYFDPKGERKDKSYTTLGCFLDRLDQPDPSLRIPPAAQESLDPSHTLCLRSAAEALADAKYTPGKWNPERVAVALAFLPYQGKKFLADSRVNYRELEAELAKALDENGVPAAQRDALLRSAESRYKRGLPAITEDTLTGHLGNLNAGRIAAHYNFRGPHFVVDAACASALAALHASIKLLHHGEADVVLSGGVWCDMQPEFFIAACRFNALSRHGSFPFDSRADGFIPGEGAGIVVLKRLSDAERDGDHIRAVLRGVAGSSDGKGRSVLAPSRAGEADAVGRALAVAGVSPHSVDYVECHGTGTALGDSVEAQALGDVYGPNRNRPLQIGSIKSNIGHLNAAAGVAGLFKAALAVELGTLPASLKCENPSSKLPSTVQVVREKRPWPSGPEGGVRRAGVSSFGVGGANFHALVEQYLPPRGRNTVVSFEGPDERACLTQAEKSPFASGAVRGGAARVAYTAQTPQDAVRKVAMLRQALNGPRDFLSQAGVFISSQPAAPVAMTFPGQGGQYPNMLRELARSYPSVQATLDEGDDAYRALCGRALTASFFTDDVARFEQRDEDMHAAVLLANVALYRLLREQGAIPSVLIGQSAGELAALVAAESLTLAEGLQGIRARTLAVLSLPLQDPGQMAALGCEAAAVPELLSGLPGYGALAADNGPRACIVSADAEAMRGLTQRCQDVGIECNVLAVSHGYHSQLIAGGQAAFQRALEQLPFRPPRISIISSIDGEPYGARSLSEYPAFLASQFVLPVLWTKAIRTAHQQGVRLFLEAGPKWSLTQFTREILKDAPHAAMASVHPKVGEHEQFSRMLAFCFVHRVGDAMLETSAVPAAGSPVVPHPDAERALLNLPLNALLSAESRWRTAVALAAKFNVEVQGATAADLETFDAIVALIERRRAEARQPPAPSLAAPTRAPVIDRALLAAEVRKELLMNAVARTGYPEEMLGLDLDLEADLGIDTVKQVDIFSRTRDHFGLARDPNLSLRDFNTLQKVLDHFVDRLTQVAAATPALSVSAGAPTPAAPRAAHQTGYAPPHAGPSSASPFAPASSHAAHPGTSPFAHAPPAYAATPPHLAQSAAHLAPFPNGTAHPYQVGVATVHPPGAGRATVDPAEVKRVLLRHAVERTGYPEDMLGLDMDLEADLGIDTVKQVDIYSRTRDHFGLERDPNLSLRDFNTLQKVLDHFVQRMGQLAHAPRAAQPRIAAPPQPAAPAPTQPRTEGNGPHGNPPRDDRSVLDALLQMDLTRELGLSEADKQKLGGALAASLGQPAPESTQIRTLEQLVRAVTPKRHP